MKPGDLVFILKEDIYPCVDIGNYGGRRLMNAYRVPGLLLKTEKWWGEPWSKVMFGNEIGWVINSWIVQI